MSPLPIYARDLAVATMRALVAPADAMKPANSGLHGKIAG
jgi:hypothetical protein